MKKYLLLLIVSLTAVKGFGQIVSSSCSAPDSILELYIDDADRLALRKTNADSTSYIDSVAINKSLSDSILGALIAVYNATALPARNDVVLTYSIHSWPDISLNLLEVHADSNLLWMQQLKVGNIPTGNAQIDSFISVYNLNIQSYYDYFSWFAYHRVIFIADSNLNMQALANLFLASPGVYYSYPVSVVGDGNNITATVTPGFIELIYSYGWGDCPAGCICRRYWEFKVYYDCTVEFVGSYGCPLPVSVNSINDLSSSVLIAPNPVKQNLSFTYNLKNKTNCTLQIYNVLGQKVFAAPLNANAAQQKIDIAFLNTGVYYCQLFADGEVVGVGRFVKQ